MRIMRLFMVIFLASLVGYAQTAPPTNLTGTVGGSTYMQNVSLAWAYGTVTGTVKYNIYKKTGALTDTAIHFSKWTTTSQKTYVDNQVQAGKKYSYYVTAVISNVESVPSNKIEVSVVAPVILYGKISGKLFADSTLAPVFHGNVQFIPVTSSMTNFGNSATTDSNGKFTAKLQVGQYYIYSSAQGYYGEYYNNVQKIADATKITLNANDSLIYNIGLAKIIPPVTYTVTGWVKNGSGSPQKSRLSAFVVNKQPTPSCWNMGMMAMTDSLGNFKISGVRANDTLVIYADPDSHAYYPQYYNGKSTFSTADKIAVTGNVTGINFTLVLKPVYNNGISGTVKDSAGTHIVKGQVYAYQKATSGFLGFRATVKTDTVTGAYSFTNLEPGQYILLASGPGYAPSYFKYDGSVTNDWRKADSVVVAATGVVSGISFHLRTHTPHIGGGFCFGSISGTSGTMLPGSLNYILDADGNFVNYAVTDLDGSYIINNLEAGTYTITSTMVSYQNTQKSFTIDYLNNSNLLVDVSLTPNGTTSASDNSSVINGFELKQNYPNPFNPSTLISYQIPQNGFVSLKVYNVLGNEVATLVNKDQTAGKYNVTFKANNLASGIYFYKLEAGNFSSIKKLILLK